MSEGCLAALLTSFYTFFIAMLSLSSSLLHFLHRMHVLWIALSLSVPIQLQYYL